MTTFGGEAFLSSSPPDLESERKNLVLAMILSTVICIVIIPRYAAKKFRIQPSLTDADQENVINHKKNAVTNNDKDSDTQTKNSSPSLKRRNTKSKNKTQTVTYTTRTTITSTSTYKTSKSTKQLKTISKSDDHSLSSKQDEIPALLLPVINIMWLISILYIILISSNNTYSARSTFQAPLLMAEECQTIIKMAQKAAHVNYQNAKELQLQQSTLTHQTEKYLTSPEGWHKARHSSYPTTDLNFITDPFTKADRDFLEQILNARLAPLMERIYGVTPAALRANDIFVVRYDADNQSYLKRHTDSGDISFNVLLNSDFTGGGTRFWNRASNGHYTVNPTPGDVILSNAMIKHEGVKIDSGVRYILVGFVNVDNINPFTKKPTGLSKFSSWFNMVWILNRVKAGYHTSLERLESTRGDSWMDNKYGRGLFLDFYKILLECGDLWAHHMHVSLTERDDGNDDGQIRINENYIKAMDSAFEQHRMSMIESKSPTQYASWFGAQNLRLDFDGSFVRVDSNENTEDQ